MKSGEISIQQIKNIGIGLNRLHLSDGRALLCPDDYLPQSLSETLTEGRSLSAHEIDELAFSSACYKAEKAATLLVQRAEQSVAGLRRKLGKKNIVSNKSASGSKMQAAAIEAVIERLLAKGLLSDERFTRLWLEGKIRGGSNTLCPAKLKIGLKQRGIGYDTITGEMEKALSPEIEMAMLQRRVAKLRGKKAGQNLEHEGLRRLLRQEGFSKEAIGLWAEEEG
ncbi:MAG: RecX family transcriptional regulator [Spirochaetaceae bacterium]|jgi:SOS response regulatory protein OraA/RecX|nr:RecX family transcriptional regulator [Spirochaetaceae bacterium]